MKNSKEILEELKKNEKVVFVINEYELNFDRYMENIVSVDIRRRCLDKQNNHLKFDDETLLVLIQDLLDLGDWRKYKELKHKLKE